jgi:hypothetical protein
VFQKSYTGNILGIGRNKFWNSYFSRTKDEDQTGAEEGPGAAHTTGGAAQPLAACGDPGLPSRIPVMHRIHDPRKTVMNPHNRVGITEYIIHYINKSFSLTWPLGRIQMPRRASSLNIAAESQAALVARVMPLPYRRLTGRRILVRTGVVELLTIIIVVISIIWPS